MDKDEKLQEELRQFILSVIALVEKLDTNKEAISRALFDSYRQSADLEQMGLFLNCFTHIPKAVLEQQITNILDLCHAKKLGSEGLQKFTKTIKLLDHDGFNQWPSIFEIAKCLNDSDEGWLDFLTTVRHLSMSNFKDWDSFFKMIKSLEDFRPQHVSALLTAFRHAIQYFKTENSLRGITRVLSSHPQFTEAFSHGQLDSKTWLMDKAISVWGKDWGRVFVLAGWIGVLPRFIFEYDLLVSGVRSFDIDTSSTPVAEMLNQSEVQQDWKFKAATADICQMQYPTTFVVKRKDGTTCELTETPDVIINTSCEHLPNLAAWWAQVPKGSKVILQSNDGFHIEGHVACFKTLKDFETAMNLSQIDYSGEKALPEFNRFMIIGKK